MHFGGVKKDAGAEAGSQGRAKMLFSGLTLSPLVSAISITLL